MQLFKWLVSKLNGHRVGQVRYLKATPFIVGEMCHFLPTECWTTNEASSLKYCCNKERWDGFRWVHVERLELTRDEWRETLTT